MDRIIEISVNGSHLTKDSNVAGVQHEANAKTLRITFDEGWDGYAKKVTFWDALDANPVKVILGTDRLEDITKSTRVYLCPIPGEAMTEEGQCRFVIDGYLEGVRQRSLEDMLKVYPAGYEEEAGEPTDPTPSQAEQLQGEIEAISETIREAAVSAAAAAEAAENVEAKLGEVTAAVEGAQQAAEDAEGARAAAAAAQGAAEQALSDAVAAKEAAESAADAAAQDAAAGVKDEMAGYVSAAEAAQAAAEQARDDAQNIAGGDFASTTYVDNKAETAESNANRYTDEKFSAIPTPDVSGQIESHNTDNESHADIRNLASTAQNTANSAVTAAENAQTIAANAQEAANSKAPMYTYGTEDIEAGSASPYETGHLHFVIE